MKISFLTTILFFYTAISFQDFASATNNKSISSNYIFNSPNSSPANNEYFENEELLNDRAEIKNIEQFPDNEIDIIDRWGVLRWRAKGYNNREICFKGKSNQVFSHSVPDGLYYSLIRLEDQDKKKLLLKGSFWLKR